MNFCYITISLVISTCWIPLSLILVSGDLTTTPTTKPIISFCASTYHACAVFGNKRMKCWGLERWWGGVLEDGTYDKVGDEINDVGKNISYVNFGTSVEIEQVSCGTHHTCVRLSTGALKCAGANYYGQTGLGTSITPISVWNGYIGEDLPIVNVGTGLKVLNIAIGVTHTCTMLTGNKIKCFGLNATGQLGLGDRVDRGTSTSDMGDNLPFVQLGTDVEIASLHSSQNAHRNCVILSKPTRDTQRIKCWGFNPFYQLGYGDKENKGDDENEMGDFLPLVDLGIESRVKIIAFGDSNTCFLLVDNNLKCIGYGAYGQLGSGTTTTISAVGDALPIVQIDSSKNISIVAGGTYHTCIVYDDQLSLKCFGGNEYGQLGQGDTVNRGNTPSTIIPSIPFIDLGTDILKIASLHVGEYFNCIIFVDYSVKCFGWNEYSQLAIGSTQNIGDGLNEMGENLQYAMLFSQTHAPTTAPTQLPTTTPTNDPTVKESTKAPTKSPTRAPTSNPITSSSNKPTTAPSIFTLQDKMYQTLAIGLGVALPLAAIVIGGVFFYKFKTKTHTNSNENANVQVAVQANA